MEYNGVALSLGLLFLILLLVGFLVNHRGGQLDTLQSLVRRYSEEEHAPDIGQNAFAPAVVKKVLPSQPQTMPHARVDPQGTTDRKPVGLSGAPQYHSASASTAPSNVPLRSAPLPSPVANMSTSSSTTVPCDLFNTLEPASWPQKWREYERYTLFHMLHENYVLRSLHIVISRCANSIEGWLETLLRDSVPQYMTYRIFVYEKCGAGGDPSWDQAHNVVRTQLPNVGFNDHSYATYLHGIERKDMADAVLLLVDDPFDETCDIFNTTRSLLLNPSPGFYSFSRFYEKTPCKFLSLMRSPRHPSALQDFWTRHFARPHSPSAALAPSGS